MAIKLEKTTNTGVIVEYWKVYATDIKWHGKFANIVIAGYLNQEIRNGDYNPEEFIQYSYKGDDFFFDYNSNPVNQMYSKLKTLPEWEGYEDIIEET